MNGESMARTESTDDVVNLHEAKTHLSRLIKRVEKGEQVIIARAGTPVARLVPLDFPSKPRIPGQDAGQIRISDDFDAELPEEELELFEQ